ncbi:MAG: NACHT domain-containing protein [Thermodesulfobacteriota bacterium]
MARREADVRHCFLYGTSGQGQRGIDFIGYAGDIPHQRVRVYQCKREKTFSAAKIGKAVDKFLAGNWDPKPARFILCSSLPFRATALQEEIGRQITRLTEEGIEFEPWDSEALSERLKKLPDLVDDFFGRTWVQAFNGPESVSGLGPRLSGEDILRLRGRLFALYATLFDRHDPGLPGSLDRRVPYQRRYIPPDIGEHRVLAVAAPLQPLPAVRGDESLKWELESTEALFRRSDVASFWREHPISQREFTIEGREPALQWLPKSKRTVILGEPGIGKSALLRFVVLSLLDPKSPDKDLAHIWGERLPVWMSFNAWTRAISSDEAINLEDFLLSWLHQHSADDLKPLLQEALKDHRLLLLIDGLDERYSEEAANVALDRLDTFLAGKDIPVVLSSRPIGYERVRRPSGEWRHGRLLDFSDEQIRDLAHFWFSWLTLPPEPAASAAIAATEAEAQKETDIFLTQLAGASRVRDLARVPLFLILLIEVSRYKERLPEHRIKAYDLMVDHLLRVHPARRRQAAGITQWDELIPVDDLKEAMARLALRIQENHGGGYAPSDTCQEVFIEYLSDSSAGLGYPFSEARTKAVQLIQNIRQGLGLLVERGIDELGFIHLTLQEYLAASMIATKQEVEQYEIVKAHWGDPRWSEVIVSLLGIHGVIRRDRGRVVTLLDHLRSLPQSKLDRFQLLPLVAETVFGDLGLPPARARLLAEEIFEAIEELPFTNLQRNLAGIAVLGLHSEYLREIVGKRLMTWFPARDEFRRKRLLVEAMEWEPAEDLKKSLLAAIRDEDAGCRVAAAGTLGKIFAGDAALGAQLLTFAKRGIRPELREAALIALARGWPDLSDFSEVLEISLKDRFPGVRLSAALARIQLGCQDDHDWEILWKLGGWDSGLAYSRREEIPAGIIKGWPGSQNVKRVCQEVLRKSKWGADPREEGLDEDDATAILIKMFPGDNEVAELLAERIRGNEFVFGLGRNDVWELMAKNFRRHPALVEAATSFLKRRQEKYPALYLEPAEVSAIIVTGNVEFRDQLINTFPGGRGMQAYWMAAALTHAWPEDKDVKAFLRRQLDGPIKIAAEVAPFINVLDVEPDEKRRRLLAIIRNPDAPRVWIVLSTLLQTSTPDEEVLEASLASLTTKRHGFEDDNVKQILIKAFPRDPRVEALAWDLWNEPDTYPEFLAKIYRSNPHFRPLFLQAMRPANGIVRLRITECLRAGYVASKEARPILEAFLHEYDPTIRTTAVLSLASHAFGDVQLRESLTSVLIKELRAVGTHFETRRAAAVAGLLHLGEYEILRDVKGHDGKPEKFYRYLEPWRPIEPLIREFLKAWIPLHTFFGKEIYERFETNIELLWETAAPLIMEFPIPRNEFESFLRGIAGKSVGPNTLQAMAVLLPRSPELRETCIKSIEQSKEQYRDATKIAARILGQHFGGEQVTLDRLRSNKRFRGIPYDWDASLYMRVLLAMCYGWPDAPELREWLNRPRAEWGGMPWYIGLHLGRIANNPEWVLKDIEAILNSNADRVETHDKEISQALQLWASEEGNRSLIISWLDRPQPSEVATSVGILSGSGSIGPDLRIRLMRLFEQELRGEKYPPRVGLDLSVGQLRVIAESIYDTIRS